MCDYDTDEELETRLLFRKPKSSKELTTYIMPCEKSWIKK